MVYWLRKDFETYLRGLGDSDDPGWLRECLGDYPKRTGAAAAELRERGIEVNQDQLKYLAMTGICGPSGGGARGADYRWSAEQIDQAAEYFASGGKLKPTALMCRILNLDFHQVQMALLEAGRRDGLAQAGEPTAYVMHVRPGIPGQGICATVEFTTPDPDDGEGAK